MRCTIEVTVKSIYFTCGSLEVTKSKFLLFKNVLHRELERKVEKVKLDEVGGHEAKDQKQYELSSSEKGGWGGGGLNRGFTVNGANIYADFQPCDFLFDFRVLFAECN